MYIDIAHYKYRKNTQQNNRWKKIEQAERYVTKREREKLQRKR